MIKDTNISENQLLVSYGEKVCMNLLKDHTTQQNIYWATDSYADLGDDFTFFAPITLDKITSYISDENTVVTKEQFDEIVKQNRRLGTRRLVVLLRQVFESLPPNRTYTSRCIRLSVDKCTLFFMFLYLCVATWTYSESFSVSV